MFLFSDQLEKTALFGYPFAEKKEVIAVIEYLKNPKKFNSAGAKMARGILLFGPPGVGNLYNIFIAQTTI